MKRPVILLALGGESAPFVDALQRAGFDAVDPDALEVMGRTADLGVIDCELDETTVRYVYDVLHVDPAIRRSCSSGSLRTSVRAWAA